MILKPCNYCNRRLCAAISGDTSCSQFPLLLGGVVTTEEITAAFKDWGMSPCDILCIHANVCSQITVSGADTHLTPILKNQKIEDICGEHNPEVTPPNFEETTGAMNCAGFQIGETNEMQMQM